jgi:hypothetical protein
MLFSKDPFHWAVSKSFANRFGMPEKWIDNEINGALAVAWRTTTIGQITCGYGGDASTCWPPFTCQMDIYVDSDAPIPWRFSDVQRDFFWRGVSSFDFVPRRMPDPRRSRYVQSGEALGGKGLPFLTEGLRTKSRHYTAGDGTFSLVYFDRAYAPGVALIGFISACPNPAVKDAAILRFYSEQEQARTRGNIEKFSHVIEFSEGFMERISAAYSLEEEKQKELNSVYQQVMKKRIPPAKN